MALRVHHAPSIWCLLQKNEARLPSESNLLQCTSASPRCCNCLTSQPLTACSLESIVRIASNSTAIKLEINCVKCNINNFLGQTLMSLAIKYRKC